MKVVMSLQNERGEVLQTLIHVFYLSFDNYYFFLISQTLIHVFDLSFDDDYNLISLFYYDNEFGLFT